MSADDCPQLFASSYNTPVGDVYLLTDKQNLLKLVWTKEQLGHPSQMSWEKSDCSLLKKVKNQLDEYFKGKREVFDIPCLLEGTDFQQSAWNVLQAIPYGKTLSYQEQAIKVRHKNLALMVGSANGKNPISIIIPCHRVINKSGNKGGYGGGRRVKEYLLNLESN
jgi:methylated-DNA-[protein]-cysteine S-methyltransferase